jgi:hypothetical protein
LRWTSWNALAVVDHTHLSSQLGCHEPIHQSSNEEKTMWLLMDVLVGGVGG